MYYLIATITLNTLIFLIFRSFVHYKVNVFQAIVINYIICALVGFYFLEDYNQLILISTKQIWVQTGVILGVLFVFTFYLIGYTTQVCGISSATVANKMSLLVPVYFSLYVFNEGSGILGWSSYLGLGCALIAIIFTSIKPAKQSKNSVSGFISILLSVLVFLFGGAIDTLINYSKLHLSSISQDWLFTTLIFMIAALFGLVVLVIKLAFFKEKWGIKSLMAGIILGVPNFFSVYYLIKTLSVYKNNGAFVFPVANMGIIVLSGIFSIIIFKESLSLLNKLGIGLALLALFLVASQEILNYLGF